MTQGPLQPLSDADPAYVVLRVVSVGVNKLPMPAKQGLEELFGPIPELLEESLHEQPDGFAAVIAQASASGYANHFEAIAADTPSRPVVGENGLRHDPKPTAHGSQSVIVVDIDGGDSANGVDEIYCDKLGRVRIRFHWQLDATLPSQIAQEFAALCEGLGSTQPQSSLKLYALVDGAFDETFFKARYPRTLPARSLYADTALQALGLAAPHLQAAPDVMHEAQEWLGYLFSTIDAEPMLSLIASPLSVDELAHHMRPYLIAITSDTVEWPIRWGDTRVLPKLLEAFSESRRDHLLSPMRRWWSVGRDGDLLRWDGRALSPAPAGFDKMPLNDKTFAELVDSAEADAVLANLYDSQPDLFRADSPAQCHARVARHLELASANGLDAAPARQHFSALALILAEDFTEQPDMVELLRRTRQGAGYHEEVTALPDQFWSATDR